MEITILSGVLVLFGLFTIYGTVFLPSFYWDRGRILRARNSFGDKAARIMYFVSGIIMVGLGAWMIFVGI